MSHSFNLSSEAEEGGFPRTFCADKTCLEFTDIPSPLIPF